MSHVSQVTSRKVNMSRCYQVQPAPVSLATKRIGLHEISCQTLRHTTIS